MKAEEPERDDISRKGPEAKSEEQMCVTSELAWSAPGK